jgi:biotin transporter BioY
VLRALGVMTMLRYAVVAMVLLAIWQGFNGDIGVIASTAWGFVQTGADVVTRIWESVNSRNG